MDATGMIHSTAIIHPKAKLDPTVRVGPFTIIDGDVTVGPNCVIGPHSYLTGITEIGADNQFHSGCVIGDAPQDLKYKGAATSVRIGERNVFREHVTVHRSNKPGEETVVGSDNFLMANSHVGHNSRVGNNVVMANGALLGGHVEVGDRATISGNCAVHQFVRVGTLAMMQGGTVISMDLPPYTMVHRFNELRGINIIGLRRAGFTQEERMEVKRLYRRLFRSAKNLRAAVAEAQKEFQSAAAKTLLDFMTTSKRGFCVDMLVRGKTAEGGVRAGSE